MILRNIVKQEHANHKKDCMSCLLTPHESHKNKRQFRNLYARRSSFLARVYPPTDGSASCTTPVGLVRRAESVDSCGVGPAQNDVVKSDKYCVFLMRQERQKSRKTKGGRN